MAFTRMLAPVAALACAAGMLVVSWTVTATTAAGAAQAAPAARSLPAARLRAVLLQYHRHPGGDREGLRARST